mmetsp:Transcript_24375/g.64330  ORF Transcript_24375/g.64330 Transcript_24375/m.64330 type:complete len:437 (+) Transcript_24375:327-1637(+)
MASSRSRMRLARSPCSLWWPSAWISRRLSYISRVSFRSLSLWLCAPSRWASICSRSASLLRTASASASSDSWICSRSVWARPCRRSRSPSTCARRASSCRQFLRAVAVWESRSETFLTRPSSFSCRALRSVSAALASASRAVLATSTLVCSSETSLSRRAMSSSSSPARALWRFCHASTSLTRTSFSVLSLTWRLCCWSLSLVSSSWSSLVIAVTLSIISLSSCFMLVCALRTRLWTSPFSWLCMVRIEPDLEATARARRQHSSSWEVSRSRIAQNSSSQRLCSSSTLLRASAAHSSSSRRKDSSRWQRFSMSTRRCCVRLLTSCVCLCTSSMSLLLVPLSVRRVPWSSSFASATRSMSPFSSWHRLWASLRLCLSTSYVPSPGPLSDRAPFFAEAEVVRSTSSRLQRSTSKARMAAVRRSWLTSGPARRLLSRSR